MVLPLPTRRSVTAQTESWECQVVMVVAMATERVGCLQPHSATRCCCRNRAAANRVLLPEVVLLAGQWSGCAGHWVAVMEAVMVVAIATPVVLVVAVAVAVAVAMER